MLSSVKRALAARAASASARRRAAFFDCAFVWTPRALVGEEPYVVFADEQAQPFALTLITACRGDAGFRGVVREVAALPTDDTLVFCEAPVWARWCEKLAAAGVRGERALVLLYVDVDPTGFWDFARACGSALGDIFRHGLTADAVAALEPYLERWAGARVAHGRLVPHATLYVRDYPTLLAEGAPFIVRVMAALADDESRAAYARILFGAPEQTLSAFASSVWGDQQYMALARPQPGDVIVNCGVGRGWELPYFLALLRGRGHIHNIDPNIAYDGGDAADLIDLFTDMITDHRLAAGDRDGAVALDESFDGMLVSAENRPAASAGSATYPMRTIDSLMAEGLADRLDYLKMDVEGGEPAVLRGAIETIRRHRPKLAVAVYHEPRHLWELPCFILDHLEDYRLYIRQHGYSRFETLLYAAPIEAVEAGSGVERPPASSTKRRRGVARDRPLILAYLRDAPAHPRGFFAKPIRPLTRVCGLDWESADITPGPDVSVEHVDAVIETPAGAVVLARHREEDGRRRVSVGLSRDPAELTWLHVCEAPDDAACVAVDADDARLRYLIYSPSREAADLHEIGDSGVVARQTIATASRPLAARWRAGALELLQRDAEDTLAVVRTLGAQDRRPTRKALPPGRLLGVASIRNAGHSAHRMAIVMRDPHAATASLHAETRNGFERVGELAWDDRFELVATLVQKASVP